MEFWVHAKNGDVKLVEYLTEKNKSIEIDWFKGWNLICKSGHMDLARFIVDKNDNYHFPILHTDWSYALSAACKSGSYGLS